ncbi:thermonuclease family protein [Actinomycetospora lutea]|uniref:thermonuclease family protein n=1 Tax=Actinomycetospora lutea TaxID=663604 RepID=UPI002365D993|nr:thermonuclease family protein [Actinomycetospora lutea]MDD7942043.1 thermonuclease family protein [Actinomycetospora lutea]
MRQAHQVWLGIAAGVFVLVAVTDLGSTAQPTPAASSSAAPSTTTTTTRTTTTVPTTTAAPVTTSTAAAGAGETVTVTDVIDGDTLEVSGDRRVRLLGIDACEMSTRGGREAKDLLEGFVASGQVRLVADGARDRDGSGRLLRRVETTASSDLGELMVIYPTVGVYDGRNGAAPEYLSRLRAADHGERECSGSPTTSSTSGPDVDVDLGDGRDNGLPDGALTGGYCARKWWC